MLKTRKLTGSWLLGGLVGAIIYFVIVLLALLILSSLVVNENVSFDVARISVLTIMMLASYLGCVLAGGVSDHNKLFSCVVVLVGSLVFRLILTLFTYDRQIGGTVACTVPEILGFVLAILTLAKGKGKRKTRKIQKRYL